LGLALDFLVGPLHSFWHPVSELDANSSRDNWLRRHRCMVQMSGTAEGAAGDHALRLGAS
jgi:hypothetical protein